MIYSGNLAALKKVSKINSQIMLLMRIVIFLENYVVEFNNILFALKIINITEYIVKYEFIYM